MVIATSTKSGLIISPSYFKPQMRWLLSFTRISDLSQLIGILSFAAFLQLELFWVKVEREMGMMAGISSRCQ
ncbi:hypothetical protein PRCB_14270 [Pantoea rodasii]|uniref:Uncharacterized protein n=1 Tax=Pantoea rodasii TaxID=1076549 RepID=A0A2M9WAT3_9GAMM|nr:hypothetical protein HA45_03260 [Pantoea rodasii]PJZ04598.1 hypothetical protein PRCB_14270 [Pantoea rodasii]